MNQEGLIDFMIETINLDVGTVHGRATFAEAKSLVKDMDGEVAHDDFSYSSVVGMLLYLSGNSTPDIAYAMNCAACFIFFPGHSHERTLKPIGKYLKATWSRGLILNHLSNLKIDCYPDAYFVGMYGHKIINDLACVKSRTGYVITVVHCPVL